MSTVKIKFSEDNFNNDLLQLVMCNLIDHPGCTMAMGPMQGSHEQLWTYGLLVTTSKDS